MLSRCHDEHLCYLSESVMHSFFLPFCIPALSLSLSLSLSHHSNSPSITFFLSLSLLSQCRLHPLVTQLLLSFSPHLSLPTPPFTTHTRTPACIYRLPVPSNRTMPSESKYLNTRTSSKTTAAVVAMEMEITWTDLTVSLALSSELIAILQWNLF
jgi:hypothetical protein